MKTALVALGLVGVAAYAMSRAADAAATSGGADGTTALDYVNPLGTLGAWFNQYQVGNAMQSSQMGAALETIAISEGTARAPDPYRVCYGYKHTIFNLSDHPAITGEWMGEPLDELGPSYKGLKSTAAGKHQINKPTWLDAKRALGLTDFTAASQDAAAAWLIKQAGAQDAVESGDVATFVRLCASRWASFAGANAPGQHMNSVAMLEGYFEQSGGVLA